MTQPTLFDLPGGRDRKDRGTTKALAAVGPGYRVRFEAVVRDLAASQEPFTAEHVVDRCGLPRASAPNANNGIGALFHAMTRLGLIRKTGRMVQATRRRSNARELREWIGCA